MTASLARVATAARRRFETATLLTATLLTATLAATALSCGNTVLLDSQGGSGPGGSSAGPGGGGSGGAHVCTAGFADCNGTPSDGCETSLTTDSSHCGFCGHDCEGAPCAEGLCEPQQLLAAVYFGSRIALDASSVYWTSANGSINALPIAGGFNAILSQGEDPYDIAVDDSRVYWTNTGSDTVASAPLEGGSPQLLAEAGNPLSLALHAGSLYFTDTYDKTSSDEHVTRVPLPSGPPQLVGSSAGAHAVAVDDERAYWTDRATDTVWSAPVSGGESLPLATGIVEPTDIEVDSQAVYVTGLEATYRIPLPAGPPEVLVSGAGRGLALFGADLYVGAADGRILRVPKTGGAPVALSRTLLFASDIAVDEHHVYWIVRDLEGILVRTPR